jgi:hypothetical protein
MCSQVPKANIAMLGSFVEEETGHYDPLPRIEAGES